MRRAERKKAEGRRLQCLMLMETSRIDRTLCLSQRQKRHPFGRNAVSVSILRVRRRERRARTDERSRLKHSGVSLRQRSDELCEPGEVLGVKVAGEALASR